MKKDFANELREEILKNLKPEDGVKEIDIQDVVKNNNTTLTGLVFKGDGDVAPIIYVERAYEQHEAGKPMEDIVKSIIDTYHESVYHGPTSAEDFLDYDKIKDKLIVSAVNTEANQEMLKDIPHIEVEDVSIIARIEVSSDAAGVGTVKVNDQLLEAYGVTKEELFDQAWASMKNIHPVECKDMIDVIKGMHPEIPEPFAEMMEERRGELFVVQTDNGLNGGAYGFDKETLTKICDQIDSPNIYIMPSSVNEVIVAPESKVDDPERLSGIVGQVNDESVPDEEVLSDNAYFFNSQTQELSVVDTDPAMTMKI